MNPSDGARSVCRSPTPAPDRGHTAIRRALVAGLLLILALWIASASYLASSVARVEARTVTLQARLMTAENLLATIRTEMLFASVLLRDALQGPEGDAPGKIGAELQATRSHVDQALDQYAALLDSAAERTLFDRLHAEIDDYWRLALPGLSSDAARRAADSQGVLRRVFIPKRDVIFRVSESVQALKRAEFAQQGLDTARLYRAAEGRMALAGAAALVLSILVGGLLLAHAGQLERRLREQQLRDAQTARDLQRLSARLVDVQEQERRAVARELHDEVGQTLTALKMELAHADWAFEPDRAGSWLDQVRAIADRALQSVRDLTRLLHPRLLDDLGLVAALEALVRECSRQAGVSVSFVHDGVHGRAGSEVDLAAYRVVQEALTNVTRHASAASCEVRLERTPEAMRITVQDDGCGFDPEEAAASGRGVGLLGIQERVAACGGRCVLQTAPGRGTRLMVDLPVRPAGVPTAGPDGRERGSGQVEVGA